MMDDNRIPPLMTPYLLGRRVELQLSDNSELRGIVVSMRLQGQRELHVIPENEAHYHDDFDCWFPSIHAKAPRRLQRGAIRIITVLDRIETKVVGA